MKLPLLLEDIYIQLTTRNTRHSGAEDRIDSQADLDEIHAFFSSVSLNCELFEVKNFTSSHLQEILKKYNGPRRKVSTLIFQDQVV